MNFEGILTTEGPAYSFAAAVGGNTSVIDFAFQAPPVGLIDTIETRKAEFEGAMAVDYGPSTRSSRRPSPTTRSRRSDRRSGTASRRSRR